MNLAWIDQDVRSADPDPGFISVQFETLRSISATAVDLFVQYDGRCEPRLFCRAGVQLDPQQFIELQEAGIEHLFVRNGDFGSFCSELLETLESFLRQDSVPATSKYAAMQVAFAVEIERSLRLAECDKFHKLAETVGNELVTLFANGDTLPSDLFRIARHDFNTFTHVTNVASYSVILAQRMGVSDQQELRKIASAAVLHDIGKRFIPASILTKRGRLNRYERAIIESHPLRGYEELCQRPDLEFGQLMMVYQHHERVDGTGYPVRICGNEIHPWAKLLAVVDVFDAMTAKRPYRRPAKFQDVLEYQRQRAGAHFDEEVVECWISVMTQA